ncbi:efflux RND transporter periplasmic adaptor subunit [Campylobacter mucosalis]|uniref:efflux RND transporter periplasmic adaptor subunit n=1 Tax=Campylobacter mucosalis TaxID=202 RepID=UPI0014703DC3|nr:efflux RND transporter periplasmic adaptor subunit [Campylobacter mucosalis]
MNYKHIVFSLAILAGLTGCDLFSKKENTQANQQAPMAVPVDVIVAKTADNQMSFEYPARIQSKQDVTLTPKVSGTIIKQNFKPGDSVKAGQTLFVIEPDTYEASYEVAQAGVLQAEANVKNAKNEMDRVKKLYEQKATSQKEYDSALASFEVAKANLASAEASEKSAKLNLGYTNIKAPFDGVVSENLVDVGTYVIAGNANLVRVVKTNPIEARFYIADTANLDRINNIENKNWVQLNANAKLVLDKNTFDGKVNFIDNIVDQTTGSILAKAEFSNDDGRLLAGTFAKIIMEGFVQKDSFLLPQIAIKQDTTTAYVLVAKDGKVDRKNIQIKYQTSNTAIVYGLENDDQIIINNFNKIRVGAPITAQVKENK